MASGTPAPSATAAAVGSVAVQTTFQPFSERLRASSSVGKLHRFFNGIRVKRPAGVDGYC
jgi:hypothetical protein